MSEKPPTIEDNESSEETKVSKEKASPEDIKKIQNNLAKIDPKYVEEKGNRKYD